MTNSSDPKEETGQEEAVLQELADLAVEVKELKKLLKQENNHNALISSSKAVLAKTASIFNFVLEKADKLLSKKFFIATLIVIAPVLTIYCTFFDITPVQNLFYWASSRTTEKTAGIAVPIMTGAVTGTAKAILNDKVAVAEVVGIYATIKLIGETIRLGVPGLLNHIGEIIVTNNLIKNSPQLLKASISKVYGLAVFAARKISRCR